MTHRTHASARAQQLLLALLLASLAGTGCFNEDGFVTFGIYEFSAGFKPSLSPVSQNEIDALEFASDGGPDGNEIVSEVDWSTLKMGSAHVYGKLRRSQCLWVSNTGRPRLSWDTIIGEVTAQDFDRNVLSTNIDDVSIAGGRPRHPYTRDPLVIEGEIVDILYKPIQVGISVRLSRFDAGGDNEYGMCELNDAGLVIEDEFFDIGQVNVGCPPNQAAAELAPYTVVGCERATPSGDAGWQVEAVDLDLRSTSVDVEGVTVEDHTVPGPPHRLVPDIKQVDAARAIARPLWFAGVKIQNLPDGCRQVHSSIPCSEVEELDAAGKPGAPQAFWQWAWETPSVDADGTFYRDGLWWQENFSPNLFVSTAAVFREGDFDPDEGLTERLYLDPQRIRLTPRRSDLDILCSGTPGSSYSHCESLQDGLGVRFLVNEQGHLVTPTYQIDDIQSSNPGVVPEKLHWRVEFGVPILDGESWEPASVVPGEPLYIEFVLNDGLASGATSRGLHTGGYIDATISPPTRSFGTVRLQDENRFPGAFTLTNQGFVPVVIDAVRLVADTGFQLALAGGAVAPFTLKPGDDLDLDLSYKAEEYGTRRATVEVDLRSGMNTQTIQGRAQLYAVDAYPNVLPEDLVMLSPPVPGAYPQPSMHVLLENAGGWPLEVTDIALAGNDAGSFWFEESYRGGPIALPFTLDPGDAQVVNVHYMPLAQPGAADHEAVLRFDTAAGTQSVLLHGRWRP